MDLNVALAVERQHGIGPCSKATWRQSQLHQMRIPLIHAGGDLCFAAGHGERSLTPPTLRERCHRFLARRLVAVPWGAILMDLSRHALSQSPCNVLGNEDRRDGEHDGKDDLFDDGHAENGTTTGRLGRKKVRCKGSCYSVSYVRHEQPIGHSLLKVSDHCRFGPGNRNRQRLACGCFELDNVCAVILWAVDHDSSFKHDGFRVIARKDGDRVRLYSRPGNDMTRRFPLIVDALARLRSRSCIIDGEAVACDENGVASFDLVRHHRANDSVFLYAFDLTHQALSRIRPSRETPASRD
jgi:hypothetical protein